MNHGNEVDAHDARTNWIELIERVERGATIVITRQGVPAARLVPYGTVDDLGEVRATVKGLLAFRGPRLPRRRALRQLIENGRR